jgi:hypothetical protein
MFLDIANTLNCEKRRMGVVLGVRENENFKNQAVLADIFHM